MSEVSTWAGLDVHEDQITVAVARELAEFVWAAWYLYPRLEEAAVVTNEP